MALVENFTESVDKLCHRGGECNNIVDRFLYSVDFKQNFFHHLLENFACITRTEGNALKFIATSRCYQCSNVPKFFSKRKLKETTLSIDFEPPIACKVSSTLGSTQLSLITALLTSLRSQYTLNSPDFFRTISRFDTYGLASLTSSITSSSSTLSSSLLTASIWLKGIRLRCSLTGLTLG